MIWECFFHQNRLQTKGLNSKSRAEGKIIRTKCFVLDFNGERMQSDVTAERALSHGEKTDNHKQGSVAYPSKSSSAAAL